MLNVTHSLDENGILTIKVDTKQSFGLTSSKKSITVASSAGSVPVDETGLVFNLNVYRPAGR